MMKLLNKVIEQNHPKIGKISLSSNRKMFFLFSFFFFAFNYILKSQQSKFQHFSLSAIYRVDTYADWRDCHDIYCYQYKFKNDTLINGNMYRSIIRDNSLLLGTTCNLIPYYILTGYCGALREDTISNKVFIVLKNGTNEKALFNYNLNVGDSVDGYFSGSCKGLVTSIDTIVLGNGDKRRKWNSKCGYYIEGIGSEFGLIEVYSTSITYSQLVCVKDSATILYDSGVSSPMGCVEITSVQETEAEAEQWDVSISPNPSVSGIFNIAPSNSALYTITVYSYLGETIFLSKTIQGKTEINLFEQPSGIYLLHIQTAEGGMYYQKLVKE